MNQTELETRLRSAYRARAELVTPDDLTDEPPAFDEPTRVHPARRRPWLPPLLAAAAVVLLAAVAVVVAHIANRKTTPPADVPLRFTTPHVSMWSGVGPGWSIAVWAPTADSTRYTVYLVAPDGRLTTLTTLRGYNGVELAGVSQDSSHVAFAAQIGFGPPSIVTLDLRSHVQHRILEPAAQNFVGFANPSGTLLRFATDHGRTKIVDDAGHVRSVHPRSVTDDALNTATGSRMPVTINGQTAIVDSGRDIVIKALEGEVLTTLRMPPGGGCLAIQPWDDRSLEVQCNSGIFAVPLDGGAPMQLAKPAPGVNVGQGANVNHYPYRLYDVVMIAGERYGIEVPSCGGNDRIARIGADLVPRTVDEDGAPVTGSVTGHTDDALYYVKMTDCRAQGGTLYRYSPADHKIVALLGGPGYGGGVVHAAWTIEATQLGGFRLAF